MTKLEDQMSFYAAYHQDARNKAAHFIGVPLIMLAILVPLSWLEFELFGLHLTGAQCGGPYLLLPPRCTPSGSPCWSLSPR